MIGCDVVDIDRIELSLTKFGEDFVKRILTEKERELYSARGKRVEFLAGRFAAKEAISKAYGSGIAMGMSFQDMEIMPDDNGKPILYMAGRQVKELSLSISHSRLVAMAVAHLSEVK